MTVVEDHEPVVWPAPTLCVLQADSGVILNYFYGIDAADAPAVSSRSFDFDSLRLAALACPARAAKDGRSAIALLIFLGRSRPNLAQLDIREMYALTTKLLFKVLPP
jgi:hypothetical protein